MKRRQRPGQNAAGELGGRLSTYGSICPRMRSSEHPISRGLSRYISDFGQSRSVAAFDSAVATVFVAHARKLTFW